MAASDIRGNVDTLILKVLYEGDRYGYDMIKLINARSGGQWEIKQPTLYACLKRLEKQGFVKSYWDASESNGGKRKYYTLTERGREVFITYKTEFERTRDLFGSLISDDDSILPIDDFSDLEEETYAIPKRRSSRPRAPRAQKPTETNADASPAPVIDEPETNKPESVGVIENTESAEPVSETDKNGSSDDFVQQSFFDISETDPAEKSESEITGTETIAKEETVPVEQTAEPYYVERYKQVTAEHEADKEKRVTEAKNPVELLEKIYSESYSESASFSGAQNRSAYEYKRHDEQVKSVAPAVSAAVKPTEPALPPQPAVENTDKSLLPLDVIGGESLARREYKEILDDLVDRCEKRNAPREEQAAADTATERIEVRRFEDVVQSVTELGNDVTVRDHNDSAKVYNRKYYYYSNKLMMTHYTVMYGTMLLVGFVLFLTLYFGLGMRQRYDYLLYIFAGLFPIIMFIGAVIVFATDPDKKKRINVNFRVSFIIRFAIMIQVAVVIYCLNLIWGMPVSFSVDYVPSLIIPLCYALYIPISEGIFMSLLKSERYAVE